MSATGKPVPRPDARARAWIASAVFAGSPFALFLFGALVLFPVARHLQERGDPALTAGASPNWLALSLSPLALLAPTLVVFAWALVRCAVARTMLPLVLALLWPASWTLASRLAMPCGDSSNAAWCGHACDADPCTCRFRDLGDWTFGPSVGCSDRGR